jgi:hypothetical protein
MLLNDTNSKFINKNTTIEIKDVEGRKRNSTNSRVEFLNTHFSNYRTTSNSSENELKKIYSKTIRKLEILDIITSLLNIFTIILYCYQVIISKSAYRIR